MAEQTVLSYLTNLKCWSGVFDVSGLSLKEFYSLQPVLNKSVILRRLLKSACPPFSLSAAAFS